MMDRRWGINKLTSSPLREKYFYVRLHISPEALSSNLLLNMPWFNTFPLLPHFSEPCGPFLRSHPRSTMIPTLASVSSKLPNPELPSAPEP